MRIEFPNSAREACCWTQPLLRIGSAADNDVVIGAAQGAGHHLRIAQDRRGWVLHVLPGCSRVYVNARPVRERALLRPGDMLSVGDCRMQLCADEGPDAREAAPALGALGRRTAALRVVAGPLSGRVLALDRRIEFGPRGRLPLELPQGLSARLVFDWNGGVLEVRAEEAPGAFPLRVNGYATGHATLQPGDQLGIGLHRFVIELPGVALPEPVEPEPPAAPPAAPGGRGEGWWLIATAALIALGIALVLFFRI